MKYFSALFLFVFFLNNVFASLNNREVKQLYERGFELINEDMAKADSLISLAWQESKKSGNSKGIADGYFYKGCLYDRQMKIDSAIQYLNKANTLYHLINEWENVPDSYGRLGMLLIKKNQPQEGLKHLLEALKLAEEFKNPQSFIRNTIVLAMHMNDFTGQYDVAINYLREAESSAKKLKDQALLGHIYLQLSISYSKKGEYEQAIDYSKKSFSEFVKVESPYNQMRALFTEAAIYEKKNEVDKVLEVLTQVKPILQENSDALMKANYYKLLAEAYYEKNEFKKALSYAEYASSLLKEGGQTQSVNHLDEILFRIHYILGNRKIADSLYQEYTSSRDRVFSLSSATVDAELREKYEAQKRTQQIEVQTLELKNAKYMRQSLLGVIVLAVVLCIVIYGRLREKARNEHLLALKNEKIERQYVSLRQMNEYNETLLREIHHRVKNNIQIISSLFSIQGRNIDHPDVVNLIEKSKSRLKTISIIHNTLYTQKSLSKIKMNDFVKEIGESLFEIYNVENAFDASLKLDISGDNIYLNADTSLPLGLIINELMTNSLKYAFHEKSMVAHSDQSNTQVLETENLSHSIEIAINKVSPNKFALIYSDSGPGLAEDIDIQTTLTTGLRLIRGLLQQLNGSIDYQNNKDAHQFVVIFNEVD